MSTDATARPTSAAATALRNLREVGGPSLQTGRRRTIYRADTEVVEPTAYPGSLIAVLDLRRDDEVERVPHPLAATAGYQRMPLFDPSSAIESADAAVQLDEQYIDWLERHRATIKIVFRTLAQIDGDALVCCSAGKDRTGVVSALLARLWGADLDQIGADYAATRENFAERFAAELAASNDPERTRIAQNVVPEIMINVIEHIEGRYGSVEGYLTSIGLTDDEIRALKH
ncbi:tyrosine-protein phosphatase [Microlunatus elymi]|uniref:tyrosine-protein phosphatase n=1 Tax=Microlunatus elymi TaxID=2596828 RepID=UPI00143D0BF3|nr:tyrosine-protein phosphatase [Microlunatus elymi]